MHLPEANNLGQMRFFLRQPSGCDSDGARARDKNRLPQDIFCALSLRRADPNRAQVPSGTASWMNASVAVRCGKRLADSLLKRALHGGIAGHFRVQNVCVSKRDTPYHTERAVRRTRRTLQGEPHDSHSSRTLSCCRARGRRAAPQYDFSERSGRCRRQAPLCRAHSCASHAAVL